MEDARVLVYLHKNASWDGLSIQCASQSIKVRLCSIFYKLMAHVYIP